VQSVLLRCYSRKTERFSTLEDNKELKQYLVNGLNGNSQTYNQEFNSTIEQAFENRIKFSSSQVLRACSGLEFAQCGRKEKKSIVDEALKEF